MQSKNKKQQPSQTKISMSITKCKDNIQDMLDLYNGKVEEYLTKLVELKKEKRYAEADRCKERLKVVLANQTKMEDLMDQVDQFAFMINEAFAKYQLYTTLGTALDETNKISMSPEVKRIVKNLTKFEKTFTKNCSRFDSIFGKVSKSMTKIDSNNYSQDAEIEAIVNGRLKEYDDKTTKIATEEVSSLFDFSN